MDINPLQLSLDEVIQLNKRRNDLENSASETVKKENVEEMDEGETAAVVSRLTEDPGRSNGHGSIHDRLGWRTNYKSNQAARAQSLQAIKKAQNHIFKHPRRMVRSTPYPSRVNGSSLTQRNLQRHNKNDGNFMVNRNHHGSVNSLSTARSIRPAISRHSEKLLLDPKIEDMINRMYMAESPVLVSGIRGKIPVDHSALEYFKVVPESTSIPTHIRFALNDEIKM